MIPLTPLNDAVYPSDQPTPLQSHVSFWDTDHDGVIWPKDIYVGFTALGFNVLFSILSTLIISGSLSYFSGSNWYPDPAFRIWIRGIHKAKHGSDSDIYTRRGLFNEGSFEEIFKMYADPPYDSLTAKQAFNLVRGNTDPFDVFGWSANGFEWFSLYVLLSPQDGRMKKTDLRALIDGTLFFQIAERVAKEKRDKATSKNVIKENGDDLVTVDDKGRPKFD